MATQKITMPSEATLNTVLLAPNQAVHLDFDTSTATVDRADNSLVITFENGSKTVLNDFFVTDGEELPPFILADGNEISSSELLENMNPNLDLSTAAGPTQGPNGSGASEYSDMAGALVDGVDRLGSLGTIHWDGESSTPNYTALGTIDTTTDIAPTGPTDPVESPYNARAVAYNTNGSTDSVRFFLVDANGDRILITDPSQLNGYSFSSENGLIDVDLSNVIINADGSITLPFSSDYYDLIAKNGGISGLENLDDYITISYNGDEYDMQVIINHDGNYTPQDAEDLRKSGHTDLEEWHSSADNILGDTSKESAGGNDAMWFKNISTENGEHASIDTGSGNDTMDVEGGLYTETNGNITIDLGAGDDKVTVNGGLYTESDGAIAINLGDGDDTMKVGGYLMSESRGKINIDLGDGTNAFSSAGFWIEGENSNATITGGSGVDTVTVNGALTAEDKGSIAMNLGDGDDKVKVGNHLISESGGNITIDLGNGDDRVEIDGNLSAETKGTIHIDLGDGTNTMESKGFWSNGQDSLVEVLGGAGNDTVTIHGQVAAVSSGQAKIDLGGGINDLTINNALVAGTGEKSKTKGTNTITADADSDSSITINLKENGYAVGMQAWQAGSVNEITNFNNVDIKVTYEKSSANVNGFPVGIGAYDGGKNIISSAPDKALELDVTIDKKGGYNGTTFAMSALREGENTITGHSTAGTSDKITLGATVFATDSGTNTIKTGSGDDTVTIQGALEAKVGGKNSINTGDGNDTVEVSGRLFASGNGSVNEIQSGAGSATISAQQLYAQSSGHNTITTSGEKSIVDIADTVKANDGTNIINLHSSTNTLTIGNKLYATDSGNNTIDLGTNGGSIVIKYADAGHRAITAENGGKNTIKGTGDKDVSITADRIIAEVEAGDTSRASNTIELGNGNNTLDFNNHVYASGGINTFKTGAGDDIFKLSGTLQASGGGTGRSIQGENKLDLGAGKNTIDIGTEDGHNLVATNNGTNIITSTGTEGDTLKVAWDFKSEAGINDITLGSGDNSITIGRDVRSNNHTNHNIQSKNELTTTGDGNNTINIGGNFDATHGGHNIFTTGGGNDTFTIAGDMIAKGGGTTSHIGDGTTINTINTGDGADSVTISGKLTASAGGNNTINFGDGEDILSVARGITATDSGSSNTITTGSGSLNIEANFAASNDGLNIITSDGAQGSHAITVTITGKFSTSGTGENKIIGGSTEGTSDNITINGDISGKTSITTGSGNDVLHLNGKVGPDFKLDMGSNADKSDYDTLVLTAPNAELFEQYYDSLLQQLQNADVEHVRIYTTDPSQMDGIKAYLEGLTDSNGNSIFDGIDISFVNTEGDTLFLNLDALENLDNLGSILDSFGNDSQINVLDLSGGNTNTISLDSLIGSGQDINGLKIIADGNDTLDTTNWIKGGEVDGYTSYTYDSEGTELTILLQTM